MSINQFMPMVLPADDRNPHWASVVALWHFNGANASTVFTDSSPRNTPLLRAGNSQISTAESKFGGSSLFLDGTGDYLYSSNTALPALGAGAITIEFFAFQRVQKTSDIGLLDFRQSSADSEPIILLVNGVLHFYSNGWNSRFNLGTFGVNTWRHVALTRDNTGRWHFFLDGVRASGTYTHTINYDRRIITIGTFVDQKTTAAANKFNGYIDDLRLTYGVARYTANFVPPSKQLPDG